MTTASIRQKLHNYLEIATDKKVKAIYTMMEEEIQGAGITYTDEFKEELDRRHNAYKAGTEKVVTAPESKKRIKKLLQSARK